MSKNSALLERFKASKKEKISGLVERSSSGSFLRSIEAFRTSPTGVVEENFLRTLLKKYGNKRREADFGKDLELLLATTAEIRAIDNQAIILHGERIQMAQRLLKKYREGAFTTWLVKTYGNRQTPYNFLQYYELYSSLPPPLRNRVDAMPKQVVYSLSSRAIPHEKKVIFVEEYRGEKKEELLRKLREKFPLPVRDRRHAVKSKFVLDLLKRTCQAAQSPLFRPDRREREAARKIVEEIRSLFLEKGEEDAS